MPAPRTVRALLSTLAILLGLLLGSASAQGPGPAVDVLRVDGPITPPIARWLTGAIGDASDRGAAAVVIELDTPGGLMSSTDEIVRAILASEVPVAVWVAPENARAASAGTFIAYAAQVAAMAPNTRIGAASPVNAGGADLDETMARKVTNDAVAQIRGLAELRGRNADWAESAVRDAASITAEEALRDDVIDLIAPDLPSLLAAMDGMTVETAAGSETLETAGAEAVPVTMGWVGELLAALADPAIAYLLLALGGLGIFLEVSQPGVTVPGVAGTIAALLGLYGLGMLPVNWAGVALIGLAFVLFVADVFVPSFGTLTIGGLVSFVFGSYMLLDDPAASGLAIPSALIWTVAALLAALVIAIGVFVARAHLTRPATGREGLVGTVGMVRRELAPDGVVFAGGELWQATAAGGADARIPAGETVVIERIDGLRLLVRPATAAETANAGVAILPPPQDGPLPAV